MPNLINMFWGLFAFIFGFFVTFVLVPILTIMNGALTISGSIMNLTMQVAIWFFAVVMLFVIPLVTAFSDDDDPLFARIVKRTVQK